MATERLCSIFTDSTQPLYSGSSPASIQEVCSCTQQMADLWEVLDRQRGGPPRPGPDEEVWQDYIKLQAPAVMREIFPTPALFGMGVCTMALMARIKPKSGERGASGKGEVCL